LENAFLGVGIAGVAETQNLREGGLPPYWAQKSGGTRLRMLNERNQKSRACANISASIFTRACTPPFRSGVYPFRQTPVCVWETIATAKPTSRQS